MRKEWLTCCAFFLVSGFVFAADDPQYVLVADPYIELHTGPGAGYPITLVVERGAEIAIIKRRTDWFLVSGPGGEEGWVDHAQMEETLQPSGASVEFPQASISEYRDHRWEMGLLAGDFGGATA